VTNSHQGYGFVEFRCATLFCARLACWLGWLLAPAGPRRRLAAASGAR
jgi:hypothetical protein